MTLLDEQSAPRESLQRNERGGHPNVIFIGIANRPSPSDRAFRFAAGRPT
jgi:hypothetical protein